MYLLRFIKGDIFQIPTKLSFYVISISFRANSAIKMRKNRLSWKKTKQPHSDAWEYQSPIATLCALPYYAGQ